jgi:DEP domain-containing protein 5
VASALPLTPISFDGHRQARTRPLLVVVMSISRSESQYSRRRSNTTQSAFKNTLPPPPPLELGASKVLTAWVHGTVDSSNVILNHSHLPGVATGDLLCVTTPQLHDKSGFLFLALNEDPSMRPQLQVRVICLFIFC